MPGKAGDHDLKLGLQYLYARNVLDEQGSMNGVFSFATDRPFNAADPRTYPERLSIRVPGPAGQTSFTHSFAYFVQDKWRVTRNLTITLGLRYDVDIFPFAQPFNPLLSDGKYPVDTNNYQPRAGFAYNLDGRSVVRGGIGRYYEKLFVGQGSPLQATGVSGNSFVVTFPIGRSIRSKPGTSADRSDARQRPNGHRTLLNQTILPERSRATPDGPVRHPRSRDAPVYAGVVRYERQVGRTMSFGFDYIRNRGRNWVGFDLNPGSRSTPREPVCSFALIYWAWHGSSASAFAGSVINRFDTHWRPQVRWAQPQVERRFSGFWSARASSHSRARTGDNSGAPLANKHFQVLGEKHLDLNEGRSTPTGGTTDAQRACGSAADNRPDGECLGIGS